MQCVKCFGLRSRSAVARLGTTRLLARRLHTDHDRITRLSRFWVPTGGIGSSQATDSSIDSYSLLVRAGFLRKSQPGIFHLLPLGQRVQQKLEALISKHMRSLGASEVALSSISTTQLWRESGRLGKGRDDDLFLLQDRHKTDLLLSPTHEEEITRLVASIAKSHRDLPIRLYQITRKYRDELRPRQGLLRGREFVMKDLYTFDATPVQARTTYDEVRAAYKRFLDELKVPYLVAQADSGNMGGKLSHEYHFESDAGEDTVFSCDSCTYTANEEVAIIRHTSSDRQPVVTDQADWHATNKARTVLVHAVFPKYSTDADSSRDNTLNRINVAAVKAALPGLDIDTAIENPRSLLEATPEMKRILLVDPRLDNIDSRSKVPTLDNEPILLTRPTANTSCPSCSKGRLKMHTAIEIGHTFHLGTRYTIPLQAQIQTAEGKMAHIEMGCHGVGISRLIGALAARLADSKCLNWPAVVAPFSILAIHSDYNRAAADDHCRQLLADLPSHVDIAIDDRDKSVGWKLFDADLIGYPIIVVFGKLFKSEGLVEVQCRRLGFKENIPIDHLAGVLQEHLGKI